MPGKAFSTTCVLPTLLATAREAGAVIMTHYRAGGQVDHKHDASPVTEADRAADRLIVAALSALAPHIPIVSEEGSQPDISQAQTYWLVDPLDGTRSFVRGTGIFTVNIGLIHSRKPVLGVIYDPVEDLLYWGDSSGAFLSRHGGPPLAVHTRAQPESRVAVVSHAALGKRTLAYLTEQKVVAHLPSSSSIKFCRVAEGAADLYPRFGPTMEWDTAAGHAIVDAAGGSVTLPDGAPFLYSKPGFLNGDFVAWGNV